MPTFNVGAINETNRNARQPLAVVKYETAAGAMIGYAPTV